MRPRGIRKLLGPVLSRRGAERLLSSLAGALKRPRALRRLASGVTSSLHTRGLVLWIAALFTGILCVTQHVYSTKLAEQIDELRRDKAELKAEIGFLEIERSQLSGRERIEEYASERLGMRYPEASEVVRIGEGTKPARSRWDSDLVEVEALAYIDG